MHLYPGKWSWIRGAHLGNRCSSIKKPWSAITLQSPLTAAACLTSIWTLFPTLSLPHFVCSSFSLHPTDRILSTYMYSHRTYTKQLQLAVYLSSHRTQQPRHLCHIFYRSQSRKLQMTNFKFFCFHADSNSVLSVFCTTHITDSFKNGSLLSI